MKIALYNNFCGHLEVAGFLIELFKEHDIDIFLKEDRYQYISFFESLFQKKVEKYPIQSFENSFLTYDKIFVITMDKCIPGFITQVQDKTYGLLHAYNRKSPYINNYITLYSSQLLYFKSTYKVPKNYIYTVPFYNTYIKTQFSERKYILQIGNFTDYDDDDDFKNFAKNVKYEIIYLRNRKKNIPNRTILSVTEYLKKSLFILGRKSWDNPYSYTGSLTLAYSYNVPIILPKFKQVEYDLPCITFNKKYSELIDFVNNFNVDDYQTLCDNMEEIKSKIIEENKEKLLN